MKSLREEIKKTVYELFWQNGKLKIIEPLDVDDTIDIIEGELFGFLGKMSKRQRTKLRKHLLIRFESAYNWLLADCETRPLETMEDGFEIAFGLKKEQFE